MEKYTKKDYLKLYLELPEEAKNIFWSEEVVLIIDKLKKRYNIKENDMHLPKIIGLVLLGIVPLSKIPETFSSRIRIDNKSAERLADDVKRFILFPAKDFLERTHEEKFTIWEFRSKDEEIEKIKNRDSEKKVEIDDPYMEKL